MKNKNMIIFTLVTVILAVLTLMIYIISKGRDENTFDAVDFSEQAVRGDTFFFGEYEQDGDLENGTEPIEWIVLKNEGNKLYAMSKYGLDKKPYHDKEENVTWEKSSLREWLNGEFYETAFSPEEKAMIKETELTNADNPYYNTAGGNDTTDKVFLLSYKEFEPQTFEYKLCTPTVYGRMQGIYTDTDIAIQCIWWLRTPGINDKAATYGSKDLGSSGGYAVDYEGAAVRPCINIGY